MNKRMSKKYSRLNFIGEPNFKLPHGSLRQIRKGTHFFFETRNKPTSRYAKNSYFAKYRRKKKARVRLLFSSELRYMIAAWGEVDESSIFCR